MKTKIAEEEEYNNKFYYRMKNNDEFVTSHVKIRKKNTHLTLKKKKRK